MTSWSTQVRKSGYTGNPSFSNRRSVFTTSTGGCIIVTADPNNAGAASGYGDHTGVAKFYIYESTDRSTWTLRATINQPASASSAWTANIFPDNSIGIVCAQSGGLATQYIKMTYSGYTVGSWENVHAAMTSTESDYRLDLAITDTGVPIVGTLRSNSTGSTRARHIVFTRASGTNTWVQTFAETLLTSVDVYHPLNAYTCVAVKGGSTTSRKIFTAAAAGSTSDPGVTPKATLLNETTGALVNGPVNLGHTYAAGDLPTTGIANVSRNAMAWSTGTDEVTLGIMHAQGSKAMYVVRYSGGGFSSPAAMSETFPVQSVVSKFSVLQSNGIAMTYGADVVGFVMGATDGAQYPYLINYVGRIDRSTGTVNFSGPFYWTDKDGSSNAEGWISAGTGYYTDSRAHDTAFFCHNDSVNNDENSVQHFYAKPTAAPMYPTPANGATVASSVPGLTADLKTWKIFGQSKIHAVWQFATDSSFTTNVRTYEQPYSKGISVTLTDKAFSRYPISDTLPNIYSMPQGTWYMRAAQVDEFGVQGAWTTANAFTISHPPSASSLAPTNNKLLTFGSGNVSFTWKFTDPSPDDFQTAFQVVIEDASTGTTVLDSGKITSANSTWVGTLPGTAKDLSLRWRVSLWDKDDVQGPWSAYATFQASDPPVVTVSVPASGGTVTTAVPYVEFTPTMGGTRTAVNYRVVISKYGTTIYDSGIVLVSNIASGTLITHRATKTYLSNSTTYTVQVTVTDNIGLTGFSSPQSFSTSWVLPASAAGLVVDATPYSTEGQGYISISWNDTARDADFSAWVVYRRDDLVDAAGSVVETGQWNIIGTVTTPNTSYQYLDYYAPSGYKVNYKVEQMVNRFGDEVYSNTASPVVVNTSGDGYWLIEPEAPDSAASAFKLSIVVSDEYTDEYEEEEYLVVGRGRHVDRGEHMGLKGTLTAQIRDNITMTARQRKRRLEFLKEENRKLYLRTPFGDIYRVAVGNLGVSRIAGVGTAELVDVTIPYTEVGA